MDVCLYEISKYIKLAGKKQDKCIIKVCEKIMNDVKGPRDRQKDIEDRLSDKISQMKMDKNWVSTGK